LVAGATSVILHAGRQKVLSAQSRWLLDLLKRKPAKLVAVALANKMARTAWKLMVSGEVYSQRCAKEPVVQAA